MLSLLQYFILVPLCSFVLSMLLPNKNEKLISGIAIGSILLHLVGLSTFVFYWIFNNIGVLDVKEIVLYKSTAFEFFIDYYFDKTTAVFAFIGSLITFLVAIFSKYYMHRDSGYKRFFTTLLLFFFGYNTVVFAGNFETLFIGWEILGVCSFLLIAFYRDRYLPVKNAMKVVSIYRLGDVCLMLAMWMCHHLYHTNITFNQLNDSNFLDTHFIANSSLYVFTGLMIVVAAAAKSALFPFSTWLTRAMEGPTTSTAVFYGSLSVHLGAFLILRTYPFWENSIVVKTLIIVLGVTTSLIASSIARVQSTVKTQIGYASITQIGLIFIEIALGLHTLALVHFAGNALLRTYQLLVSPSVLSYEIHNMFFNYVKPKNKQKTSAFSNTIYMLSIKEWNLDNLMFTYLWKPFKWIGKQFHILPKKVAALLLTLLLLVGLFYITIEDSVHDKVDNSITIIFSLIGFISILKAFTERANAIAAWLFVIMGQFFVTLSITLNEPHSLDFLLMYLSGVLVCALVGLLCLLKIKRIDNDIALNRFHGYSYEKPMVAFIFFISCLGLLGFPFTPTFLGIDLLFTHIHKHQIVLITITSLSFIFIELAILRIYSRIFLGQHKKNNHPIAFRSS